MFRVIALALLVFTGTATAHGPENEPDLGWRGPASSFDSAASSRNEDDAIKMDLAVDGQTIKLFVSDADGNPVNIDIAEAKAFISSAGKTSWFSLRPAGMNVLSGEGDFVRDPGMRVDITLRLPGRRPINQDFRPFQ
ncbi:MAG: hypothetical protein BMS9Abin09_0929 [Gammaproteobacteria bacterium]|nr:MAG: hypothetical protein BMS9Abin09_0929 [Gammaproteobacteria bacterium]